MANITDNNNCSETGTQGDAVPGIPPRSEVMQIDFKTLRLRPGMLLQVQPALEASARYDAQFLGIIDGKGVMVIPKGIDSLKNGMQAGQDFVIRGFTGQHDFSFASKVIRIFDYSFRDPPLAYALLTYPDMVEARQVRGAMRVRTSLPATASPIGENSPVAVTMIDLSVAGSLISSPASLGVTGDQLNLAFSINFEDEKLEMVIPATICRCLKSNTEDAFLTGFLFNDISRNDKLILYYFVLSAIE